MSSVLQELLPKCRYDGISSVDVNCSSNSEIGDIANTCNTLYVDDIGVNLANSMSDLFVTTCSIDKTS